MMLARPLLGVRREQLRAFLRARGAAWIDDPANANPAYERVRVRARLAALEAAGFEPMRLTRLAAKLRARAERLDRQASALIARAARFQGERIVLACEQWFGETDVRRRALSVLLAAAAGAAREAAPSAVARLEARLTAPDFRGACLGGALLSRRGADIIVSRDPGALRGRADGAIPPPALPLEPGIEAVWDGRLALSATEPGWSVSVEQGEAWLARGQTRLAAPEWGAVARTNLLLQARIAHLLG
jgi:tRNA(Ile)-lysidine synthase